MVDNSDDGIKPQFTLSDFGMAILVTVKTVPGIVQMHRFKSVKSDNTVKPGKDTVKIVFQIVPAVIYMTGIHTDSDPCRIPNTVNQKSDLLEGSSYLGTLAGHCFKKDQCVGVGFHQLVQKFNNFL